MAGMFDNFIGGITKGINSVSEGSKFVLNKAQLNSQISDIEKDVNKLLLNLGTLVYNLQMNGEINIEQCTDLCNQVTNAKNAISNIQQQINNMEVQRAQNNAPYNYAPTEQPAPISGGVTCQCGCVNRPEAKFCAKCGQPLA